MLVKKEIESKANYKIPIKEYKPRKIEKAIIACHGFGGDKESSAIELLAQKLIKQNILVIAFDFAAHGESKATGKEFIVEASYNYEGYSIFKTKDLLNNIE